MVGENGPRPGRYKPTKAALGIIATLWLMLSEQNIETLSLMTIENTIL